MLLPETLRLHDQSQFEFHFIYFLPWKDQMVEAIQLNGGVVTCFQANNNLQLLTKVNSLVKYIRGHKIDLVHSHLPWAGVVSRLAGKKAGIPVVYTEHNKQERYHFATRWMNLATMDLTTEVVAVSEDVEQSIRKHKPGLKARLRTILNGVNIERFTPEFTDDANLRSTLGIPAAAAVIGTVAVFRFQKRLDLWLKLAKEISTRHADVHFVIVGDGPLKNELIIKQKEFGLTDKVHFAGLQTEVRPYFKLFDLYMMCSIFEGLPIALLEAMASGCPVITTDAGGIKEVIRHGKDGLLCPVDDPGKLVDYAADLLSNNERRQTLGLQARQRVEESFSLDSMVRTLEQCYRQNTEKK